MIPWRRVQMSGCRGLRGGLKIVVKLLKARRSEMHDDGRQGRSLAGTALVNESIQGKRRTSSNDTSKVGKHAR